MNAHRDSLRSRFSAVALLAVAGLAMAGFLWLRPPPDLSRGVQLLLSTDTLQPTTTFELRFE